jgi:hypothetical protein
MWAVKRLPQNYKEINEFFNKLYNTNSYRHNGCNMDGTIGDYLHYPKKGGTVVKKHIFKGYELVSLETLKSKIEKNNMSIEKRKIIGYKVPFDIYEGLLPKDTIIEEVKPNSWKANLSNNNNIVLPSEIVKTWEPVYEEDFKIGDWVKVIKMSNLKEHWLNQTSEIVFKIKGNLEPFHTGLMYPTSGPSNDLPWSPRALNKLASYGIPADCIVKITEQEAKKYKETISYKTINDRIIYITAKGIQYSGDHKIDTIYAYLKAVNESNFSGFSVQIQIVKIGCVELSYKNIEDIYRIHKHLKQLWQENKN